jgi:hypothetical protein
MIKMDLHLKGKKMDNVKTRLKNLEQHRAELVKPARRFIVLLSYYKTDSVPDVFDRPLEDWELYKRADSPGQPFSLTVDPYFEAHLRGGGLPLCPDGRYSEWKVQQKERLRPLRIPEIVLYAHPDNDEFGQNRITIAKTGKGNRSGLNRQNHRRRLAGRQDRQEYLLRLA